MPHSYAMFGYAGYAKHGYATRGYAGYATVMPNSVTPHSYATCGYADYAKHGYTTWLRHVRLCRSRQIRLRHIVTPHVVTPRLCRIRLRHMVKPVTPNTVTPQVVTPRLRQIHGTWLHRLRQTRLRHIVTPRDYVGYATVTPNSVTLHGYAGYAKHGYAT